MEWDSNGQGQGSSLRTKVSDSPLILTRTPENADIQKICNFYLDLFGQFLSRKQIWVNWVPTREIFYPDAGIYGNVIFFRHIFFMASFYKKSSMKILLLCLSLPV